MEEIKETLNQLNVVLNALTRQMARIIDDNSKVSYNGVLTYKPGLSNVVADALPSQINYRGSVIAISSDVDS